MATMSRPSSSQLAIVTRLELFGIDEGEDQVPQQQGRDHEPDDVIRTHAAKRSCSGITGASANASSSLPMMRSQTLTKKAANAKKATMIETKATSAMWSLYAGCCRPQPAFAPPSRVCRRSSRLLNGRLLL